MREALFSLLLVFVSHAVTLTSATVLLKPFSISFADLPAKSAVAVDSSGICGALYVADPLDACTSLRFGLSFNETERTRFALIVRGECAFEDKVRNAQNAGFRAAIVFDDRDTGNLVYMMINPENITVLAIFVSKDAGEMLKEYAHGEQGECCIFPSHYETAWTVLTISFISFIVICTILVLVLFMPRHRSYSQGMNHHSKSVDAKMVEALPCFVFSSEHSRDCHNEETCAICLEDYKDGETLKVLPCRHEFHLTCVDSWLTKWGTFCPVCKHDLRTKIAVLR